MNDKRISVQGKSVTLEAYSEKKFEKSSPLCQENYKDGLKSLDLVLWTE